MLANKIVVWLQRNNAFKRIRRNSSTISWTTMKCFINAQIFVALFLVIAAILSFSYAQQPPYQVSLFIHLHPKGPPIHLCNGAIVQSKLILTTAACVHYLLIPNKPVIPVHPSMLTVVAGSSNALTDALSVKVAEIIFHQDFNETTMENDLALLRLQTSLPLGTRDDIKWVILDEFKPSLEPCLANFHVRNSMDKVPDYTQTEELPVLDNEVCNKYTTFPEARKEDICSNYILPLNFKCDDFQSFIPFNGDRGTALICNSRLIGLLSSILLLEDTEVEDDCSEKSIRAFYTYIGTYIEWAYEIIAEEEYAAFMQENYTASAPYDQETEAIIQSHLTEIPPTESTQQPTPTVATPKPEVQPLQSSATQLILNISFKFLLLVNVVHFFL